MRIVSLLPAATEWVCAFGARDRLVGRSHECDHPDSVEDLPVVTSAAYDPDDTQEAGSVSKAIDDVVSGRLQQGLSLYDVDLDRLRDLNPDLILTQDQCEACAVSLGDLEAALAEWTRGGEGPDVFSMQPSTFKDVLDTALRLARTIGVTDEAMRVIAGGEMRLQALRESVGTARRVDPDTLPTVACIEWLDPLMTAGHWMPDVAEHAGARAVLSEKGGASQKIDFDALRDADPYAIAVLPCGFSVEETRRDLHLLTERDGWGDLRAVREGRVALLDGNAYFNRPGPRLVRSAELLASVVHPERARIPEAPADWERIWLEEQPLETS